MTLFRTKHSEAHAVLICRVYGSHHGGSYYSKALVEVLLNEGWIVTLAAEQFGEAITPTERSLTPHLTLPAFFQSGLIKFFPRVRDIIWLACFILRRQVTLIIVQGDLPRLTYVLLQYFIPLIFIRQDSILTCPANNRFLCNSRTVCTRPTGFSCLTIHRAEHCLGSLGPLHRIGRIVYRLRDHHLLKMLKHFVGNSQHILRMHQRIGTVLYPPRLSAPSGGSSSERDLFRLVFCGRLEGVKGAEDALRILSRLPKPYTLDVLGDGYGLDSLLQMAQELSMTDRVKFHGWVDCRRRDEVFGSSSVLLLPSLWDEAFGMVGLEAFAKGTPVVAYDVGGVSEWCRPGLGILVKCGDLNGFADAITRITSSYKEWRQFSVAAEAFAESTFTLADFQHKARDLIRSALSNGKLHS